ncbi:Ribosomal protein L34e superfamily protein [Abeliophyllum distichum]|uniref:Ribosomal protein L34e superfamily protein n=1 Tax=Abeliophyllum distichum TaxID=126358 RepID=A0ABD1T237_9LAMI
MAPSSSLKKPTTTKPSSTTPATATHHHHHANSPNCPSLCRHSPSATLDLLILIIVLFSGAFLIISYFSYLFQAFSLLLPPFSAIVSQLYYHIISDAQSQYIFFGLFFLSFVMFVVFFEICCGFRSRRCGKNGCKGLKKAMEFDLQLQGEELLRSTNKAVKDVNELPWKGDNEDNPDYECLRAELRKMAPPNGRAVLLFRAKCGCPVAKLEGWGPKRGRRHKK